MITKKPQDLQTATAPTKQTPMGTCCGGEIATTPDKQNTSFPSSKSQKTRVVVKYDVGFNNTIHIRGNGANLSWDKGTPMKNSKTDEWIWECDCTFSKAEFKVLINDKIYESGPNHVLECGAIVQLTPKF